ncbi:hypothetical protein DNTS_023031 [Danionella cerebrum]|uniref:NACHT domain-containing protein n=1 Tax=Danionella cerebrum TaxID=2873325 RepID=A0A553QLZ7_9TELE|nr:hypothetical protein DNTS_023031 [Danionella translucida]
MDQASERAHFVDVHWAKLVQAVNMVMPIADELFSSGMLQWETYSKIKSANTGQDKMREIYETLQSGGKKVKSAFYVNLKKHEPDLFGELDTYKKWIQKEYEYVIEYNSLPGESVLLSERYVRPLISMRHTERREWEEEMCSVGESFQQLFVSRNNANKDSSILDALFSADHKGIHPSSVILQGNSGIGKSFTAQKIMLDWVSGNLSKVEFDCLFHLKCKDVNRMSGDFSLPELLSFNSNLSSDQISQILQKSPEKVLILIDGFDELRFSSDDSSNMTKVKCLSEKSPLEASLKALLKGHILHESFLLVTTRSTATKTLGGFLKYPQRFTEIIGFSEKEVNEYFKRFFQEGEHFSSAFNCVAANETLLTACSIPVICWIVCTVMRERFSDCVDVMSGLETTTSIYVDFVMTLLEHHGHGLHRSVPTLMRSVGQLAESGMLEGQVLFEEKSVHETISECPFLCKFLSKRRVHQETMYSFMHLSFQEFFTALYYITLDERELLDKLTECFHSETQAYLHIYLDKDFPLKYGWPEPNFLAVVQFLLGLCNKEVSSTLKSMDNLSVSSCIQPQLEEWILDIAKMGNYSFLPYILHCLYELHEEEFVKRVMDTWQELNILTVQNFSDSHVIDLLSAVGEGKQLQDLKLNGGCVSDESVRQLLKALLKQKSVGGLQIAVMSISAESTLILTDFLQWELAWKEISLRSSDAKSLCSSLRLFTDEGNLVVNVVKWCSSSQNQPSISEIILRCAENTGLNLTSFLQAFSRVNNITEKSADFEKQVDALLSLLSSVSGLIAINLSVPFLTETWASRILFLVQSCRNLEVIKFKLVLPDEIKEELTPSEFWEQQPSFSDQ